MSKQEWLNMVKKLNMKIKDYMDIPRLTLEHHVMRVCQKRKIRDIQQNAMLEMAKRVKKAEIIGDTQPNTVAACIFWQIIIRSRHYIEEKQFNIRNYIRNKQKLQN